MRKETGNETAHMSRHDPNPKIPYFPFKTPIYTPISLNILETPNTPNSSNFLRCSKGHGSSKKNKNWIFDCGATGTMTFDLDDFISIEPLKTSLIQR